MSTDIDNELSKIEEEITRIVEEDNIIHDKLSKKLDDLNKRKNSLRLEKLSEGDLLKYSEWRLTVSSVFSLRLIRNSSKSLVNDLRNHFDASWHGSITLSDRIDLDFDDNDITIVSTEIYALIDFVKLHRLKVDISFLEEEIKKRQSLENVRSILIDNNIVLI